MAGRIRWLRTGFAYLIDGDPRLEVPRRSEPRTRVPAGSVGLAGEFQRHLSPSVAGRMAVDRAHRCGVVGLSTGPIPRCAAGHVGAVPGGLRGAVITLGDSADRAVGARRGPRQARARARGGDPVGCGRPALTPAGQPPGGQSDDRATVEVVLGGFRRACAWRRCRRRGDGVPTAIPRSMEFRSATTVFIASGPVR